MRAVIQRTYLPASVKINNKLAGEIQKGLVVFIGVENGDETDDIEWLARKIVMLRIFNDAEGKMNCSLKEIGGAILVISQFTLFANVKKGNRPSFINSGEPLFAKKMYERFVEHVRDDYGVKTETGEFAEDMKVHLVNDGPVTIFIDSKHKDL